MVIGQRNAARTDAIARIHDRANEHIDDDGSQQGAEKHPYPSGFGTGSRSRARLEYSMSQILARLCGQVRAFTSCIPIHDDPPRGVARYLGTNMRLALMTDVDRPLHSQSSARSCMLSLPAPTRWLARPGQVQKSKSSVPGGGCPDFPAPIAIPFRSLPRFPGVHILLEVCLPFGAKAPARIRPDIWRLHHERCWY